jgi:hypothetical protein
MRKMSTVIVLLFSLVSAFLVAARPQSSDWKPLFNGRDLTGWKHVSPVE